MLTRLLEMRAERSTVLVALGGGVVGDITGFAAAIYQRGMPFVQIPTTLLAQVDSSVGGKTGINHPLGKNMIGAFYQPRAVLIDTDCLRTLPDREFAAGVAEVIKYGAIRDAGVLRVAGSTTSSALVARDAARADARDSRELPDQGRDRRARTSASHGERALLNFGHTFGHAIENGTGYGTWLHGEAVAMGMVIAAQVSQRCRRPARGRDVQRLRALVQSGRPAGRCARARIRPLDGADGPRQEGGRRRHPLRAARRAGRRADHERRARSRRCARSCARTPPRTRRRLETTTAPAGAVVVAAVE